MHLHVGDAMPLKKTGFYLEPKVVFAEFIPKFKKKKPPFSTYFWNKFPKNYKASKTAVRQGHAAPLVAQGMSQRRRTGLFF